MLKVTSYKGKGPPYNKAMAQKESVDFFYTSQLKVTKI